MILQSIISRKSALNKKVYSPIFRVMAILTLFTASSYAQSETTSSFDVVRLNNSQPIIDQAMFADLGVEAEGENINGPSLIRIPDWISTSNRAAPSANYYLYFGHHIGGYIRMAWAENVAGPWHLYQAGDDISIGKRGVLDNGGKDIDVGSGIIIEENHLASPDVHVDNENQRIIMYFHSGSSTFFNGNEMDGQYTWVTTSPFGLDFNGNIEPVKLSTSYFRVFSHGDNMYAFDNSASPRRALNADNPWQPTDDYYSDSTLSSLWEQRSGDFTQEPIEEYLGLERSDLRVRHTAVRVVGDELQVFYTRRGDSPERVMMSTVDLSVGDWENWEFSFSPAELLSPVSGWEGGQFEPEPSETASAPEDVNQLRDPFVFEDTDGSLYLIYAGSGEDALGIAAMSSPTQHIETLNPIKDAYVRGGSYSADNYGSDGTLEIKQGSNSKYFRKSYLHFNLAETENIEAAVLRLYGTRSSTSTITLYATTNDWNEDSITWDTAPLEGTKIASVVMGPEEQWYEWDVTAYLAEVTDGSVSFVLYDEDQGNTTIRFSSKEGDNSPELKVLYVASEVIEEPEVEVLKINTAALNFEATGGTSEILIEANIDWSVSDNASWLNANTTGGSGDGNVILTAAQNTSSDSLSATITLTGGSITKTVTVTQAGKDVSVSDPEKLLIAGVSASTDDGNVVDNTQDTNLETRWSAKGDGEFATYDLGEIKHISAVNIAFYKGDSRTSYFSVAVSDNGSEFTTVLSNQASSGGTLSLEAFEIGTQARYVRIIGHGNSSNTWNSLTEVELWGTAL